MLKKIVIIGPESTGKSTLSAQLADHYKTTWCPEYARAYLLKHGMNYSYDDLLTIAKGQIVLEEEYIENTLTTSCQAELVEAHHSPLTTSHSHLFIDTDMYVMKIWCEFVFGKCHRFILEEIAERKYDCYLLCNIDLPWVADELREYPDLKRRQQLYMMYKDCMINQDTPWVEISGNYEERLQVAVGAVDKFG